MRKAFYAIPIVAAGAFAAVLSSAPIAGAAPGLMVPFPTEYPWCELDLYCYDDDIDIALNPRSQRDDVNYGGGSAFGN